MTDTNVATQETDRPLLSDGARHLTVFIREGTQPTLPAEFSHTRDGNKISFFGSCEVRSSTVILRSVPMMHNINDATPYDMDMALTYVAEISLINGCKLWSNYP